MLQKLGQSSAQASQPEGSSSDDGMRYRPQAASRPPYAPAQAVPGPPLPLPKLATRGSDASPERLSQLRSHRLWRGRPSPASPQARTLEHVGIALDAWAQQGRQVASSVKAEAITHEQQPWPAPAAPAPELTRPLSAARTTATAEARSAQRLRTHRLWQGRASHASVPARAQQRVEDALADWGGGGVAHPPSSGPPSRGQCSEPEVEIMGTSSSSRGKRPRTPVQGWRAAAYQGATTRRQEQQQDDEDDNEQQQGQQGAQHPPVGHDDKNADDRVHSAMRSMRKHRLWRQRESSASPGRQAEAVVGSVLEGWVQGARCSHAGGTAPRTTQVSCFSLCPRRARAEIT